MIRTILFDIGNVLVDFSHERMCAQIAAICQRAPETVRATLFDAGLHSEFERGRLSEQEFHRQIQHRLDCNVDFDALRLAGSDIFTMRNSLLPILSELKQQGHRLVLLSNTCVSHYEFLVHNFTALAAFDDRVVSYEVGAVKPEAAIYQAALKKIDCAPDECFYTDDVAEYVAVARTYGLQAEVFSDTETFVEQLRARGVCLTG